MNKDWFTEEAGIFGKDSLEQAKETLPSVKTSREVDFLERELGLRRHMSVLDVPCGHGRHAIELARRGYVVTGIEINSLFLEEAEKSAREAGVGVRFLSGDMRYLNFKNEFDVVVNLFTSLGYFETDLEDIEFLSGAYASLKEGGVFLIDFTSRDWLVRNYKKSESYSLPSGGRLAIERSYDPVQGRQTEYRRKTNERGKVTAYQPNTLRLYAPNEIVEMASGVGFSLYKSFGDFESNPLTLESRRTILVFEKGKRKLI